MEVIGYNCLGSTSLKHTTRMDIHFLQVSENRAMPTIQINDLNCVRYIAIESVAFKSPSLHSSQIAK